MFSKIKKIASVGIVMISFMYTAPLFADVPNYESVLNKNKPAIVKIFTKDKKPYLLGFGFVIQPEGLILTCDHIIGSKGFVVSGPKYKMFDAERLVFRDKTSDLALIKVNNDESLPVVELGNSDSLKLGSKLVTLTGVQEGRLVSTNSIIEKIVNNPAEGSQIILLQNAQDVTNMMEGSPVFNQSGEVVGILSSANDDRSILGLSMIPINLLHEHKEKIKNYLKDLNEKKKEHQPSVKSTSTGENVTKKRTSRLFRPLFHRKKHDNNTKTEKVAVSTKKYEPKPVVKPVTPVKPVEKVAVVNDSNKNATKPPMPSKRNNFNIDLTGYWFDIDTGNVLYLDNKGDKIVVKQSESLLAPSNNKIFTGSFLRNDNVYAGNIGVSIDCSEAKNQSGQSSCDVNDDVELFNWDNNKIELRVYTADNYNCKSCSDSHVKIWKTRTWLRKNM